MPFTLFKYLFSFQRYTKLIYYYYHYYFYYYYYYYYHYYYYYYYYYYYLFIYLFHLLLLWNYIVRRIRPIFVRFINRFWIYIRPHLHIKSSCFQEIIHDRGSLPVEIVHQSKVCSIKSERRWRKLKLVKIPEFVHFKIGCQVCHLLKRNRIWSAGTWLIQVLSWISHSKPSFRFCFPLMYFIASL